MSSTTTKQSVTSDLQSLIATLQTPQTAEVSEQSDATTSGPTSEAGEAQDSGGKQVRGAGVGESPVNVTTPPSAAERHPPNYEGHQTSRSPRSHPHQRAKRG